MLFYRLSVRKKLQQFLPICIWIQDQDDLGIDMFYLDEISDQYWEAQWLINRLVESDLNTHQDFLKFHKARAGYLGMRSKVFEKETELSVDEFMRKTLQNNLMGQDSWK